LDLALFIGAQHDSVFRWVEIETNNGLQFLGELGIVADLERMFTPSGQALSGSK